MSREIKFRAWNRLTERMVTDESVFIDTDGSIEVGGYSTIDEEGGAIVVMQYTGLHDRNGVEVFEGDIVNAELNSDPSWLGEVLYDDSCGQYDLAEHSPRRNNEQPLYLFEHLEVIGNIHANRTVWNEEGYIDPELFKKLKESN